MKKIAFMILLLVLTSGLIGCVWCPWWYHDGGHGGYYGDGYGGYYGGGYGGAHGGYYGGGHGGGHYGRGR